MADHGCPPGCARRGSARGPIPVRHPLEIGRGGIGRVRHRAHYAPGQVFTALNDNGAAVHIPLPTFVEAHHCVIGATRFGKGVTYQSWTDQAIRQGHAVWMFDPKGPTGDDFMPTILKAAARDAGRPFVLVNLNDDGYGTWGPLEHGTLEERIVRAIDLLDIKKRGSDADHYKALSRDAVRAVMTAGGQSSLGALVEGALRRPGRGDGQGAASRRWHKLRGLAARPGLTPKAGRGLVVEDALRNNAVVYIIGSIDDADINLRHPWPADSSRVQNAPATQGERTTSLLVASSMALKSPRLRELRRRDPAAASAANINLSVAFQSFADMLSPDDKSLDGDAVLQSVLTNCQVKLIFGGTDAKTAEWVAETSGTVYKRVAKMERTRIGVMGGETWEDQRTLGEEIEPLIPENITLSLPEGRAVLFQPGRLAELVQVAPIRTPETEAIARAKAVRMGLAVPVTAPVPAGRRTGGQRFRGFLEAVGRAASPKP